MVFQHQIQLRSWPRRTSVAFPPKMRLISLLVQVVSVFSQSPILRHSEDCVKPQLEITVSSLMTKTTLRELDIAWDLGNAYQAGAHVALYKSNVLSPTIAPVFQANLTSAKGWVSTGVQEGRLRPAQPNYNKTCMGWSAAVWTENETSPIVWTCLSTNPRWMEEMTSILQNVKLKDLFLPGSHDSGSFSLEFRPRRETRFEKYIFTQDETLSEQLIHGVRILDLRIGSYDDGFWLNHGVVKVHPLEGGLYDIRQFIENTREIVILDFHEFPVAMTKMKDHDRLVAYLLAKIGDLMIPNQQNGWLTTVGQIWNGRKRVIVAYNNIQVQRNYSTVLWYPVRQYWPNVQTSNQLRSYLASIFNNPPNNGRVWSAMAELTPTVWNIITDSLKGLRVMADLVNHYLTELFLGPWGRKANAVSVDFIRSTGIVKSAIRWNYRKMTGCDP